MDKLLILPGLLIAITFHELAHGLTSYKLGDPTAKNSGRLTLNPFAHIDIVGFLLLFTVGYGWAKPVPINPMYYKKRKLGTILVSLAGPLTNFLIAIITTISIFIIVGNFSNSSTILLDILRITIWYNIILGLFNLLPFPPLDGSKIIASILPTKYEILFYKYEKYLYILLVGLAISGSINRILAPLIDLSYNTLFKMISIFL